MKYLKVLNAGKKQLAQKRDGTWEVIIKYSWLLLERVG